MNLTILMYRDDAALHEKIRQIVPGVEIVTQKQVESAPELLPKVEIAYEGLRKENLPLMTSLKWIQRAGAGVEGLLTPELRERNLLLTNVSGIHARAITEHMFGLLLSLTRGLYLSHETQKKHEWKGPRAHIESLYSKTLGILGVGAIGGQSARVGKAFDMKVIGLRRSGEAHPDIEVMYTPENRLEFFQRSDVVMNVLPLTPATRGFMSDAEFEALPQDAIVINTGRGATIDTPALMRALQSGKLKAALLDVTSPEPLPADHPLWDMPNVVITPHYSGAHPEYNAEADEIFLDNLRLYVAGEPLHHMVDQTEGY